MKGVESLLAFNRGRISRHGVARVDIKRVGMSAEVQTNFIPRVLGSAMLRPGFGYINTLAGLTKFIPFVFAANVTARIEVQDSLVSFCVNDVRVSRPAVTAAVTNPGFTTNFTVCNIRWMEF